MRLSFLIVVCFSLCMVLPQASFAVAEYVGSEKCSECHLALYSDWSATGHHLQLRKAEDAQHASLPLPQGYTWDDVSYVIGGVNKKARFVDRNGYLITSAKNGSKAKTQYNLENDSWSDYLPGEKKPYDCAFCHTTGYSLEGHQNGLLGIVGTWEEDGIGCEACHPSPSGGSAWMLIPRKNTDSPLRRIFSPSTLTVLKPTRSLTIEPL